MKIEEMLIAAENYSELALKNLMLDSPRSSRVPDYAEHGEVINALVEAMSFIPPETLMSMRHSTNLQVHFLFPNLSDEKRQSLVKLSVFAVGAQIGGGASRPGGNEKDIAQALLARDEVNKFENELSALQLELLDSPMFYWGAVN